PYAPGAGAHPGAAATAAPVPVPAPGAHGPVPSVSTPGAHGSAPAVPAPAAHGPVAPVAVPGAHGSVPPVSARGPVRGRFAPVVTGPGWWDRIRSAVGSALAVHGLAYLGVLLFFVGLFGLVAFAFNDVSQALRPVAELA